MLIGVCWGWTRVSELGGGVSVRAGLGTSELGGGFVGAALGSVNLVVGLLRLDWREANLVVFVEAALRSSGLGGGPVGAGLGSGQLGGGVVVLSW
jgi:hypothetical protein